MIGAFVPYSLLGPPDLTYMGSPNSANFLNNSNFCSIDSILIFVDFIDWELCLLFNLKFLCYHNVRYLGCDVARSLDTFIARVLWDETNLNDSDVSIYLLDNVSYAKNECISNRHFLMKERLELSVANLKYWRLIIKWIYDNVIYKWSI